MFKKKKKRRNFRGTTREGITVHCYTRSWRTMVDLDLADLANKLKLHGATKINSHRDSVTREASSSETIFRPCPLKRLTVDIFMLGTHGKA